MSFNNIKTRLQAERGFTIVELLIVIVVIGILAAITIVSYNGVTARANTASSQSAVSAVASKAEAYAADVANTTGYPNLTTQLAVAGKPYTLTGVTISLSAIAAAPASPSTVNLYLCGTSGSATVPANLAAITVYRGNQAKGWDYNTAAISTTVGTAGQVSGNDAAGFPIACFLETT